MKDIEIAVLYKKEIYDGEKGIYCFKPFTVVEGFTDQENDIYLDESNKERYFINDVRICSDKVEFCIGNVADQKTIKKLFPDARTIEEAKIKLIENARNKIIFGFLCNEKIEIRSIFIEKKENSIEDLLEKRVLEDENYQQLKKQLNLDFEFTILTKEVSDYILKLDNIEEIQSNLIYLLLHKDCYQKNFDLKSSCYAIRDEDIYDLILQSNLEKLKEKLNQILSNCLNNDVIIERKKISFKELNCFIYNNIITSENMENIEFNLNSILGTLEQLLEELKKYELTEHDRGLCEETLNLMIQKVKSILTYNHSEETILENYKNMYYDMTNLINAVDKIFSSEGITIESECLDFDPTSEKEVDSVDIENEIGFDYNECYQYMTSHVIGRRKQIGSILSMIDRVDHNPNEDKKTCGLIVGMGGTGKTQTFTSLRKIMPNRPITITDTNQLTSAGYTGGTIESNVLTDLIMKSHQIHQEQNKSYPTTITQGDILLAERGIVFLDEIDKRKATEGTSPDVNGSGVINALLKMMDGTTYQVTIGKQTFLFDTSRLVIFAGGAFQEYFEYQNKVIGYQKEGEIEEFKKFLEVNPDKLVKYGLSSQFIGRCSCMCLYPSHTKESLTMLEKNKETSFLQNRVELFKQKHVCLVWEEEFFDYYIEEAMKLNTGARGLERILNRYTNDAYGEVCKYPDFYKAVYLGKDAINHPENVVFLTKNNEFIQMECILKKNEEEEAALIKIDPVEPDSTYLHQFQKEKMKLMTK